MSLQDDAGKERGAFLYEFLDGLFSYALVLTRDRAEAEDLVQETCVRAIRAMDRLRAESNLKSWLFTILRNIWLNQLRRRRTIPEMVELDVDEKSMNKAAETTKDPQTLYIGKVEREQVRAAIEELSWEFREVVILREYEDLSYQEIAGVLHCPVGTVMSRLARARSKLKVSLSRTNGPLSVENDNEATA